MMAIAAKDLIDVDEKGVARIVGSRIKVKHLMLEHRYHHLTPEQIQENLPHLTLSQIHAAFAYYYENQSKIDEQIREDDALVERLRAENEPFQRGLKEKLLDRLKNKQ